MRVAVFASGRGSNLQALIIAQQRGRLETEIVAVASDRRRAGALQIASDAGIATVVLSQRDFDNRLAFDLEMFARVAAHRPDLIVLAGYMRIVDPAALATWSGPIINIHPSLLPKYPGLHTHERAITAGDVEHGASVHSVTAELDGGPVIAQTRLAIRPDDTPDSLAARLLPLEHELLIDVVCRLASAHIRSGD
ncbi:MAG: phosphoribosylglycinamide formyltransferase [Dokdonella sp.]